jgi:hypothetical protein
MHPKYPLFESMLIVAYTLTKGNHPPYNCNNLYIIESFDSNTTFQIKQRTTQPVGTTIAFALQPSMRSVHRRGEKSIPSSMPVVA